MSKFIQFTIVHSPDLNPNSYNNLNSHEIRFKLLDKCLRTKVKFS